MIYLNDNMAWRLEKIAIIYYSIWRFLFNFWQLHSLRFHVSKDGNLVTWCPLRRWIDQRHLAVHQGFCRGHPPRDPATSGRNLLIWVVEIRWRVVQRWDVPSNQSFQAPYRQKHQEFVKITISLKGVWGCLGYAPRVAFFAEKSGAPSISEFSKIPQTKMVQSQNILHEITTLGDIY